MSHDNDFEAFQKAHELERIMRQAKGDGSKAPGEPETPAPPLRPRKVFKPRRRFRDAS